jgi:hypothetical protein
MPWQKSNQIRVQSVIGARMQAPQKINLVITVDKPGDHRL